MASTRNYFTCYLRIKAILNMWPTFEENKKNPQLYVPVLNHSRRRDYGEKVG